MEFVFASDELWPIAYRLLKEAILLLMRIQGVTMECNERACCQPSGILW